jgi:hypothetical protein
VTAGLAEVAAGTVAMGLGGFLAAKTDAEQYESEMARERCEIDHMREREAHEVEDILKSHGLEDDPIVGSPVCPSAARCRRSTTDDRHLIQIKAAASLVAYVVS